jgi:hypothetical protein
LLSLLGLLELFDHYFGWIKLRIKSPTVLFDKMTVGLIFIGNKKTLFQMTVCQTMWENGQMVMTVIIPIIDGNNFNTDSQLL